MFSSFEFKNRFRQAFAWVSLLGFFPTVLILNGLFLYFFPQPERPFWTVDRTSQIRGELIQMTYVHQNRQPGELFSDFNYALGIQLMRGGQLLAAEPLLAEAGRLTPDKPSIVLANAYLNEALERNDKALGLYEQVIKLDGNNIDAHYRKGMLLDKTGKTLDGVDALKKALNIEPDNVFLNYDIGVFYAKLRDFDGSATYSQKAALIKPDFAEAWNNYAYALANLNRYEESLKAIEHSLTIQPESAASLDTRGFAYQGMGKYKEALTDYEKALSLDDTIGEIYLHQAQVLEKLDRPKEALASYINYLTFEPNALDKTEVESIIKDLRLKTGLKAPEVTPGSQKMDNEASQKPVKKSALK